MVYPLLDLATFKVRTLMAAVEVDYVEGEAPGFTDRRIAIRTSWMNQRLRKRYGKSLPFGDHSGAGPLAADVPEVLLGWLTAMVTLDVLTKRGMNTQDPAIEQRIADALQAEADIKEAADGETGLFDLPSVELGDSNVSTGSPLGYSETSPYVGQSIQSARGRAEDRRGRGTGDG